MSLSTFEVTYIQLVTSVGKRMKVSTVFYGRSVPQFAAGGISSASEPHPLSFSPASCKFDD